MRVVTFFILISLTSVIVGCTTLSVPQVQPSGKYAQLFLDGRPIMQLEYDNGTECGNQLNRDLQLMNVNARQMVSSGMLKLTCATQSLVDELTFSAIATEILTNRKQSIRFASREACVLAVKSLESQPSRHSYSC